MNGPKNPLSFRQIIDLVNAGSETAAKMGQHEAMRKRLPDLFAELEAIATRLEALGLDGWKMLRDDQRLFNTFCYYDSWRDTQKHGKDTSSIAMRFKINAADALTEYRSANVIVKKMYRRKENIRLVLDSCKLHIECGDLSVSMPASYNERRTLPVRHGVVKLMMQLLKKDEKLECEFDEENYRINGFSFRLTE